MSELRYHVYVPSPNAYHNLPSSVDELLPAEQVLLHAAYHMYPERVRIEEHRPFSLEEDLNGPMLDTLAAEAHQGLESSLYTHLDLCWDDGDFTVARPDDLRAALREAIVNYARTPGAFDVDNAPWQPTGRTWTVAEWKETFGE